MDWLEENGRWKKTVLSIVITSIAFLLLVAFILYTVKDIETATSDFAGLGVVAIPAIFVYAVFNTSFPEELLFRGFLLKRLEHKFGFGIANTVQAIIFGSIHGLTFFLIVGWIKATAIFAFTTAIAWLMGYINEQKANGSIIPSWLIHAISNIFSGLCAAFSVF